MVLCVCVSFVLVEVIKLTAWLHSVLVNYPYEVSLDASTKSDQKCGEERRDTEEMLGRSRGRRNGFRCQICKQKVSYLVRFL